MSVRISVDLLGDKKLLNLLATGGPAAAQATGRAIYEEAQIIFAESQRLVPVRTGALRASGQVFPPKVSGNDIEVEMGYGGAAAPYAIYVHERLDLSHDAPTSAKFLETPVLQAADKIASRIADRVDATLKGLA